MADSADLNSSTHLSDTTPGRRHILIEMSNIPEPFKLLPSGFSDELFEAAVLRIGAPKPFESEHEINVAAELVYSVPDARGSLMNERNAPTASVGSD